MERPRGRLCSRRRVWGRWELSAKDFFEGILADVARANELEAKVELARNAAGPHGQGEGAGGGAHDALSGIDSLIDSGAERELERMRDGVNERISLALAMLYGRSGRGGLARSRGSTDADILCCRYLQGYGWSQIARMMGDESRPVDRHWCQTRASRALAWIDSQDVDMLVGT